MSIVVYESDPRYLETNNIMNVDVIENNSSNNKITKNNVNQVALRPDHGNWNLEVTVFNVGLQCAPDSEFFKIPPCTGPYPNYNLTITTSDKKYIFVNTDSKGKFKTLLKPGQYIITAAPTMKSTIPSTYFTIEEKNVTRLNLISSDKGLE